MVFIKGKPYQPIPVVSVPSGVFNNGQLAVNSGHKTAPVSTLLPAPPNQGTAKTRTYNNAPKNAAKNITSEKINQLIPCRNELSI